MTDPTKPGAEPHSSDKPIHDNPMADSPAMDAPAHEDMAPDPITILEAAHDAALKEAAAMKDRALRTLAEMENLRKRTEREVADAKVYGVTSFARDLLSVADAVRRAFESIPADTVTDGPLKAFFEGIALTESELLKVLAKHGVKKVEPDGMKFDPNLHQAMFEVPNPDVPSGTVVQTVQAGYTIGDRVLRPALVGVSKGGPKAAPQASSASPA